MRIMTWNIQNCGTISFKKPNINNIQNILNTIKDERVNPDILVVQEYQNKYYKNFVEDGLQKMSYSITVCEDKPSADLRNRVLIASKLPFIECERPIELRMFNRKDWNEIYIPEYKLRILGVHVPLVETTINGRKKDNREDKRQFLETLKKRFEEYKTSDELVIILGDFNLHDRTEFKEYIDDFSEILNEISTKEPT